MAVIFYIYRTFMSQNVSDYTSPYNFRFGDYIPENQKNPLNEVVMSSIFDRFVTREETQRIIGTIGRQGTSATNNLITEDNVFDQAYQLQPVITSTIGTENQFYTYQDLLNICTRNGINVADVATWQEAQGFNFALPIDLDKFINYINYYWVSSITPEYVTIRNNQIVLQSQIAQIVTQYMTLYNTNDPSRLALWNDLSVYLDYMYTQVATTDQIVINNLDTVIADTIHPIYVVTARTDPKYTPQTAWQSGNYWLHKLHVSDVSNVSRAQMPILEYSDQLQLTSWTYTTSEWMYRKLPSDTWASVSFSPTDADLFNRYPIIASDPIANSFTIAGNYVSSFVVGNKFAIEAATTYTGYWTITNAVLSSGNTVILVKENVISGTIDGNVVSSITNSRGDAWFDFDEQWMFVRNNPSLPTIPPANQITAPVTYITAMTGQALFELPPELTYIVGANVLNVYINNIRQYGNYDETSPTSITFYTPCNAGDIVSAKLAYSTASDKMRMNVPVRTFTTDGSYLIQNNCLVVYRKTQQRKTDTNEYPLFDVVDLDGTTLYESSSLITFTESSTEVIDPIFGKRIIKDSTTKDYTMSIDIVDTTIKAFVYNGVVTSVWCPRDTTTIPVLVDSTGTETTNTTTGVYQIPDQFTHNVHHELRSSMLFSELFAHFRSISLNQTPIDSVLYGNIDPINGYHLMNSVDYGVGGSICEYNGGFDTFASTLIASDHQYTDVIQFARDQYRESLVSYYNTIKDSLLTVLPSQDPASVVDLVSYLSTAALDSVQTNSLDYNLYGDSSIYTVYGGIQNWIATIPYFGLYPRVVPELAVDNKLGILELVHHDGHSILDEYNLVIQSTLIAYLVNKLNLTDTAKQSEINSSVTIGQLAYNTTTNTIYRLNIIGVSSAEPLLSKYADGSFWVSLDNFSLYKKESNAWVLYSTVLDDAWVSLDFQSIILDTLLDLEDALYNGAAEVPVLPNPLQNILLPKYLPQYQAVYEAWAQRNSISDPYAGDFVASDPFTWNYNTISANLRLAPSPTTAVQWESRTFRINKLNFGTPYPHLQPWILQGYSVEPDWWGSSYAGTTRPWSTEMWTNIMNGVVPIGYQLPNGAYSTEVPGEVAKWNFVSVNITNQTTTDGYAPDDLLPPYWVPTATVDNISGIADQVFLNCNYSLLTGISVNTYPFGSNGPYESEWKHSLDYLYDLMVAEYYIDPITFIKNTFGETYKTVNELDVSTRTGNVYSHKDVVFHGDIDTSGNQILLNGVNQWYTQYFRYINLDTNATSYKDVWKNWNTSLCYNVGSYVIDNTLSISSTQIAVSPNDYAVYSKVNTHVRDVWIDALYISVNQVGTSAEMPKGSGRDWKFNVAINCPTSRALTYYDVKKTPFVVNTTTNLITISGTATLSEFGWTAGQQIVFDTGLGGILPQQINDLSYYYLIPVTDTTFRIAESAEYAMAGKAIALTSTQYGVAYVGQLSTTFYAFSQAHSTAVWRHFALSTNTLSFTDSTVVTGVQSLVDIIDGYKQYLLDQNFIFNMSSAIEYDSSNNRQLNWQYETERVIDTMYKLSSGVSSTAVAVAIGTLDVNPFRNNLWITHAEGVVSSLDASNINQTLYKGLVYNSSAQLISTKEYNVLRKDTITHFSTVNPVAFANPVVTNDFATIQYLTDGIGGAHLYFDEYEHIIVFSDTAISGDLIYDPFLYIQVPKLSIYCEKQVGITKRPNIGGYILSADGSMMQNLEYTVANINNYYDTFTVNENSDFVSYARALLGYREDVSYLANINTSPKSQFLFYKGLIHNKGTLDCITAYTNASILNSAEIDEFWAYRSHLFGQNDIKTGYLINLDTEDTVRSHLKLEFVAGTETAEAFFTPITSQDSTRWLEYPNQRAAIIAGDNVSFDLTVDGIDTVTLLPAVGMMTNYYIKHEAAIGVQLLVTTSHRQTFSNVANEILTLSFSYPVGAGALIVYLNGEQVTSTITELAENKINVPGSLDGVVIVVTRSVPLIEYIHYTRINNRIIQFNINPTTYGDFELIRYSADVEHCVPVSILDNISGTTLEDMTTWDPQAGMYTDEVALTVDVFADVDPAAYNTIADLSRVNNTMFWTLPQQGTVWADTLSYRFVRYNDTVAIDTSVRLANWGRMEEWSAPTIYTWIGTTVLPIDWTDGAAYSEVYQRTRDTGTLTVAGGLVTITGITTLMDGDEVVFFNVPTDLTQGVGYTVTANGANWIITNSAGAVVTLVDGDTCTVYKATFTDTWTTVARQQAIVECAEIVGLPSITTSITANTEYVMYLDGVFIQDGYTDPNGLIVLDADTMTAIATSPASTQLSISNRTGILDGLSNIQPDDVDLTNEALQQYIGYPMVTVSQYNETTNVAEQYYYYWVTGSSVTVGSSGYLTDTLQSYISTYTKPFVTFSKPVYRNSALALSQIVAVGVSGLVSAENRYVLRLTRDGSLRTSYLNDQGKLLKPIYSEWKMFRQNQIFKLDRRLWDLITEAMIGYQLADPTVTIPALDRVVYDKLNGTNTRLGYDYGQALLDADQAIAAITAVVNDPTIDYSPNDIDLFLATHDLTTITNIITFMDDMYTTLTAPRLNQIFFAVLTEALSNVGSNFSTGIIKTSAISVKGSMSLNVNGALDG